MPEQYKSTTDLERAPVISPGYTFGTVTEKISAIVLTRPASNGWFIGFGLMFMMTMMMLFAVGYLFLKGIGIWGVTTMKMISSTSITSTIGVTLMSELIFDPSSRFDIAIA